PGHLRPAADRRADRAADNHPDRPRGARVRRARELAGRRGGRDGERAGSTDSVVVAVVLAGDPGVEVDRLDGLVLPRLETGQDLENLVLPEIDRHGERDPRLRAPGGPGGGG